MLEPADVLILDEPTNDLDLASLDVLEESLEDFPGAVVLVTHDRAMLDRLATRVLALDGHGGARYFADYQHWQRITHTLAKESQGKGVVFTQASTGFTESKSSTVEVVATTAKKKLRYYS